MRRAVAGYLQAMGLERRVAPAEIELTISPAQVPNEHMDLWGWEDPLETRRISTGAAFLGLGGAKVLLEPFATNFDYAPARVVSASSILSAAFADSPRASGARAVVAEPGRRR